MLAKPIPRGDPNLAIAYVSVSIDALADTEEAQRRVIEDWARRQGVVVARWHIEHGDSPEMLVLQAAIADLPVAGAGLLIAASPDHVGAERLGLFMFIVNAQGARLVCADGGHLPPGDQRCPTCDYPVQPSMRYPRSLCGLCLHEATDERGRPLRFQNVDMTGGFRALYADTGEERRDHVCYVHGVKCIADEARFGGIVIQPAG